MMTQQRQRASPRTQNSDCPRHVDGLRIVWLRQPVGADATKKKRNQNECVRLAEAADAIIQGDSELALEILMRSLGGVHVADKTQKCIYGAHARRCSGLIPWHR